MVSWSALLHLGDLRLTVPLALGIGTWLMAQGARAASLRWGLLFAAALLLVGASKVAYLGWGGGIAALELKSLSGHATGSAAVFPLLFYLMARGASAAAAAGLLLGLAVAVLLVLLGEHSLAEALAGCALGAGASLAAMRGLPPAQRSWRSLALAALVALAAAWLMQWAHVGWWMIRAARYLSGNPDLYPLTLD